MLQATVIDSTLQKMPHLNTSHQYNLKVIHNTAMNDTQTNLYRGRRGRDHMDVGFIATDAISANHH